MTFWRAAWLGALAGLCVAAVELVALLAGAMAFFDGAGEIARLCLLGVGLGAGLGALAGALTGAVVALTDGWSLARRAWLWTFLFAPLIVRWSIDAFAGPRVRDLAARPLLVAGLALIGLAATHVIARRVLRGPLPRMAGFLLGALVIVLAFVDQRVLVRLYPFFHHALRTMGAIAAGLAVASFWRAPAPRLARFVLPSSLAAGVAALYLVGLFAPLRGLLVERGAALGDVVRLWQPRSPRHTATALAATPDTAPSEAVAPHLPDVDIVLITIDAWRADRLRPSTTPAIAALADSGVRFSHAYAQVPHTSFSVATLLTGKHLFSLSLGERRTAAHQTLPALLRRERWKTAAFYPPSAFFIDRNRLAAFEATNYDFEYVKLEYLGAAERTDQVLRFFADEKPRRAFVWVHYLEPHEPYEAHPGLTKPSDDDATRYDGEIRFVDGQVARLVEWLRKNRPHTLVVVSADHGEELDEHGGRYHGTTLYDEQLRVPLVWTTLDGSLARREVKTPVGLVDVAPTLLELLGVPPSLRMQGRSLAATLGGGTLADAPVYSEIGRKKAIVSGNDKLICDLETDSCALYDLAADPREQRARFDGTRFDTLKATLTAWIAGQARYEQPADSDGVLERARHGDRTAAPELAARLGGPSALEAAALLAALPSEPATRPAIEKARADAAPPLAAWLDVTLARLGDEPARARVIASLDSRCATAELAPCARAALAVGSVRHLAVALGRAGEDHELSLELIDALGRSGDAAAYEPLVVAMGGVRARLAAVTALSHLGRSEVIPLWSRWVAAEPYVPVRAEIAAGLGSVGKSAPAGLRAHARSALQHLLATEQVAQVRSRAEAALAGL
jgi:arylsulfatase A-like enzyme